MTSQAQIDANRANSQFSTGPRTEEGKNICRFNSLKHGCYANTAVVPGEGDEEWREFVAPYVRALAPKNMPQLLCAEGAALAEWRLLCETKFIKDEPEDSPDDMPRWYKDKLAADKEKNEHRAEMHLIRVRDKHLAQFRLHKNDKAEAAKETRKAKTSRQPESVASTIPVAVRPDPQATSPIDTQTPETRSDSPEEVARRLAIREESLKFYREQNLAESGLSEDEINVKIENHLSEIGLVVDSPQTEVN